MLWAAFYSKGPRIILSSHGFMDSWIFCKLMWHELKSEQPGVDPLFIHLVLVLLFF